MSRLPVIYRTPDKRPDPGLTPTRLFLAALLVASLVAMAWVFSVA